MKYRGIVFDKDGTLLDFNRTWLPIYRYAAIELANGVSHLADSLLGSHGFNIETERFASGSLLAAGNNNEIAIAWSEQLGVPDQVEAFSQRLNEIFHTQGAIEATAVNHLQTTLTELKNAGIKLGVATADSHQGILNTLQTFDVLDHFDFLAGYDSGHGVKPSGDMVLSFCSQMELTPDQVVVVGDNRHDIEMGRNANAGLCVGVLTGTSTRHDLESLADVVVDDISHLPQLL